MAVKYMWARLGERRQRASSKRAASGGSTEAEPVEHTTRAEHGIHEHGWLIVVEQRRPWTREVAHLLT